jgi:hypothetical protein
MNKKTAVWVMLLTSLTFAWSQDETQPGKAGKQASESLLEFRLEQPVTLPVGK